MRKNSKPIPLSLKRISHVTVIVPILALATLVAGYPQPSAPPKDIAGFFQEITGEWIGTVEEYTDGIKADTKYFHGVVEQRSPETYETLFESYRIDEKTHAPVQIGVTRMTTRITAEGTATNTITGKGDVFISPKVSKPEQHQLSESLRMSPSGGLEGKGDGSISVEGTALGTGKNGKVTEYTSTWALDGGVLRITERFRITFRVLLLAKHYDIVDDFRAERGSDIMGLMKGDLPATSRARLQSHHTYPPADLPIERIIELVNHGAGRATTQCTEAHGDH